MSQTVVEVQLGRPRELEMSYPEALERVPEALREEGPDDEHHDEGATAWPIETPAKTASP